MRREKMAQLGISPQDIYTALKSKNLATSSGNLLLGRNSSPLADWRIQVGAGIW